MSGLGGVNEALRRLQKTGQVLSAQDMLRRQGSVHEVPDPPGFGTEQWNTTHNALIALSLAGQLGKATGGGVGGHPPSLFQPGAQLDTTQIDDREPWWRQVGENIDSPYHWKDEPVTAQYAPMQGAAESRWEDSRRRPPGRGHQ